MSGSRGEHQGTGLSEQCRLLAPKLAAFAEDALPPEEMRAIAMHVRGCDWCLPRVEAYRAVDALIRRAPTPRPPAALRTGLYARINAARRQATFERDSWIESEEHVRQERDVPSAWSERNKPPYENERQQRHITRWVGAVAALLIAALLAGLLIAQQQHRTGIGPVTHPTVTAPPPTAIPQRACASNEIQASLPDQFHISSLAMTSVGTGWATGITAVTQADHSSVVTGYILRYSNCRWQSIGMSLPNTSLGTIVMSSPNEGWIVGAQQSGPLLLHYSGGTWREMAPSNMGDIYSFIAIAALPSGELWLAGQTPAGQKPNPGVSLLHLAAGQWSRIDTPYNAVADIAPAGPNDAWVIGTKEPDHSTQLSELGHYQGNALTKEISIAQGTYLTRLRMLSPNEGWAMGYAYVSGSETVDNPTVNRPVAVHFDGASWTETNIGANAQARLLAILGQGEAWTYTSDVGPPYGAEHVTATQQEHEGHWKNMPFGLKDVLGIDDLVCVSSSDCWAIGSYLIPATPTDLNGESPTAEAWYLLHYAGGTWHEYGRK